MLIHLSEMLLYKLQDSCTSYKLSGSFGSLNALEVILDDWTASAVYPDVLKLFKHTMSF